MFRPLFDGNLCQFPGSPGGDVSQNPGEAGSTPAGFWANYGAFVKKAFNKWKSKWDR